jgi:hypothetical protein
MWLRYGRQTDAMNLWFFLASPFAFTALFAWLLLWPGHVRTREARALAVTYGFRYLGETLPSSLDLTGSALASISSAWNVIDGEPHGTRIIAFDCKIGDGRGCLRRTALAVGTQAGISTLSRLDPRLRHEQVADWVLIYRPEDFTLVERGLTPISELRAYFEAIANYPEVG